MSVIRISDPTRLGQTLGTLRITHGHTRVNIARTIANTTGRTEDGLKLMLWRWDTGRDVPTLSSLGAYLNALGYDLALIPRENP